MQTHLEKNNLECGSLLPLYALPRLAGNVESGSKLPHSR